MKNSIILSIILSIVLSTQLSSQTKYTRIGLMGIEKIKLPTDLPEGVSQELKWIVPPIFLESERRVMKYFTIGTEVHFNRYGINTSAYNNIDQTFTSTSLGLELQGKLSIPIAQIFEAFAQYGIGYTHNFIKAKTTAGDTDFDQDLNIGYITQTMSIGGSVILGESIGVFIETGVMNVKSV